MASALTKYIRHRIYDLNKNCLMIVVGSMGSGKSYSLLTLGEILDPSFNIDRVCFRAKEFIQVINNLSQQETKGLVVMWDELGVEHSSREFMTLSNRLINYFFQTCRRQNMIILMSVPVLSFIDSNTRKLVHIVGETAGINKKKQQVQLIIKVLQTNPMTSKEYYKYLRYKKGDRNFVEKYVMVGMPSKELIKAYEQKKKDFTAFLNKDILGMLGEKESRVKPLSSMQERVAEQLLKHDVEESAKALGISFSAIYKHKSAMERKGYVFKPKWAENRVICYEIEGLHYNSTENLNETHI